MCINYESSMKRQIENSENENVLQVRKKNLCGIWTLTNTKALAALIDVEAPIYLTLIARSY